MDRGIEVFQPPNLKDDAAVAKLAEARAEVLVVAAYGLLLPPRVLTLAPLGALNIHASLLPRWRGAAPIQRALLAGDPETGISIMQMDAGLDTGPVLSRHSVPIAADDTGASLHDKLATLGAQAIVEALSQLAAGRAHAEPQPPEGATYARKITKEEAGIDWIRPALELERCVRALAPTPGARAHLRGEPLKLWRASVAQGGAATPGTVLEAGPEGIIVACGTGALRISELQRAGGTRLGAAAFLRGFPINVGEQFGAAR